MRWLVRFLLLTLWLALGCGGPFAPPPTRKGKGGTGGSAGVVAGGASNPASSGASTGRLGSGVGGTISTYVDPGCPDVAPPEVYAECSVADQWTCPQGMGCYPTITYPTVPCEPELYSMLCLPAGAGQQWDDCESLLDCAAGFICVVTGIGTECQRACDPNATTSSCPKGLFCEPIDLQGIGSCF